MKINLTIEQADNGMVVRSDKFSKKLRGKAHETEIYY